ncbi:hypothetical protein J4479_05270 [Candidatus Woesearchaeota archaeon]|nr:hypothetical protein [Candidatus Woesearchaeota archaeon]
MDSYFSKFSFKSGSKTYVLARSAGESLQYFFDSGPGRVTVAIVASASLVLAFKPDIEREETVNCRASYSELQCSSSSCEVKNYLNQPVSPSGLEKLLTGFHQKKIKDLKIICE